MKKFKEFIKDSFSTHAAQRALERGWTNEEIQLFTNQEITETLKTKLKESLQEEPDQKGYEFFIFRRINGIPRAAIGVYKKGFKTGEDIKILIATFLDKKFKETDYFFNNVAWTIKIISDTSINLWPEKLDSPPKLFNSKSLTKKGDKNGS
mgnify:CR=1 FL=1